MMQIQEPTERGTGFERPKGRGKVTNDKSHIDPAGRVQRVEEKTGVDVAVGYKLKPNVFSLGSAGAGFGIP